MVTEKFVWVGNNNERDMQVSMFLLYPSKYKSIAVHKSSMTSGILLHHTDFANLKLK